MAQQHKSIVATQLVAVTGADGGTSLAILDSKGAVWTWIGTGWQRVSMKEAPDDPTV